MRSIGVVIFASLVGWLALPALAQDPNEPTDPDEQAAYLGLSSSYLACVNHNDGSMPSMQRCADAELFYQDKRLNRVYEKLMGSLPPGERTALRDEERAWIKTRDRTCALPVTPGQGQVLDATSCSVTESARRARVLELRATK